MTDQTNTDATSDWEEFVRSLMTCLEPYDLDGLRAFIAELATRAECLGDVFKDVCAEAYETEGR